MAKFNQSADQAGIDERDAAPAVVRRKQRVNSVRLNEACDKLSEAAILRGGGAGITESDIDNDS